MLRFREKLKGNVTNYWGLSMINGMSHWKEPMSQHPENSDVFTGLTDINGVELFTNDSVEYVVRDDKGKKIKEYGKVQYVPQLSCFVLNDNFQRLTAKTIIDRNITVVKASKATKPTEHAGKAKKQYKPRQARAVAQPEAAQAQAQPMAPALQQIQDAQPVGVAAQASAQ